MGCPSEVEIGDNLVFSVTTHDPDTGVLTDADSVPTWRMYEDETGTAILNGSMAKLDDTNTTGFYSESVACTSGNGFENGKTYTVYIEATVDSDKGGICYGFKAYDRRKTNAEQLGGQTVTAAGGITINSEVGASATAMNNFEDAFDTTGYGFTGCTMPWNAAWDAEVQSEVADGLNAYDPPTKTEMDSAFTEIKGATWASGTDTLEHIRDKQTDIETDTADIQTQVGTAGDGLTAVPWNAAWDAEVQSECDDALTAYGAATAADAASPAEVATEIADALQTDATTEPSSPPGPTASIAAKVGWSFAIAAEKVTFNKSTGVTTVRNSADSASIGTSTSSDDGTTVTRGAFS